MNIQEKPTSWFQRYILGRSDIRFDGDLYMKRWRLLWFLAKRFGGIRIHQIMRSDNDRELHDHPFWFLSFILTGGYWEHLPGEAVNLRACEKCDGPGPALWDLSHRYLCRNCHSDPEDQFFYSSFTRTNRKWHRPFSFVFHKATDLHRLELKPGTTAWTIVITGPSIREWGFMTSTGWQSSKQRFD